MTAPVPPPAVADWRTYRRLGRYLRPYAPRLFVVLAISLASTALNLAQPYLSKLMIDDALTRHDLRMLAIISGALLGVTLVGFVLNMLASYRYVALSAAMLPEALPAPGARPSGGSVRASGGAAAGTPVLLLHGAEDERVPARDVAATAAALEDALAAAKRHLAKMDDGMVKVVATGDLVCCGLGHAALGDRRSVAVYAVADAIFLGTAAWAVVDGPGWGLAVPVVGLDLLFRGYAAGEGVRETQRRRARLGLREPRRAEEALPRTTLSTGLTESPDDE